MPTGAQRCHRLRRWASAALALALPTAFGVVAPRAEAVVFSVACDGQNDIADVQGAVNGAAAGDVVELSGTCDFSAALAHGGDERGIAAAAVLVRPGTPVTGLTIRSANPAEPATIVGSGTQTAFAVVPGNNGTTIRGIRIVNLARPLAVVGAQNVTIGIPPGQPLSDRVRIVGHATMDSAVFAVANDAAMQVAFGAGGTSVHAIGAGAAATLTGLTARGVTVTYEPPGPGTANEVVAIDVRQVGTGTVGGPGAQRVLITENIVGMFAAELASSGQNAVRVEGLAPVPASNPPAVSDYRIRNVLVTDNNLGRLDELTPGSVGGVDPNDTHYAGRIGILLERVGEFEVARNDVRTRLSATGLDKGPGGGIVASDSAFGTIEDNDVLVIHDPAVADTADIGAIGVIEDLPAVLNPPSPDQATTDVEVLGNVIGDAPDQIGALRGIVVSGARRTTVWNNDVVTSRRAALFVGADIRGPTGGSIPRRVTGSVLCSNLLDGVLDQSTQVSVNPGTPPTVGNAFPGGGALAGNFGCQPTLTVNPAAPAAVGSGGTLLASGKSWAGRPFQVTVTAQNGASTSKPGAAGDLGDYSVSFTDLELSGAGMNDGRLTVVTTADPGGTFSRASLPQQSALNLTVNPPAAGTVTIHDDDGFSNSLEVAVGVLTSWAAANSQPISATIWWSTAAGGAPPVAACGPFEVVPTGQARMPLACGQALPQGTFYANARWMAGDGETSGVVSDNSVKDTQVSPPVMTSPAQGAQVESFDVTFSGTVTEGGSPVTVRRSESPFQVLGTATANGLGNWQVTVTMAAGDHSVSAYTVDPAGNRSASFDPPRTFTVVGPPAPPSGDVTPPVPPTIAYPADNSTQAGSFPVIVTTEANALVGVFTGPVSSPTLLAAAFADADGVAGMTVTIGTGTYNLFARARDAAGNVSDPSAQITVQVDSQPPILQITTPNDSVYTVGQPLVVQGTGVDNQSGLQQVFVEFYRAGQAAPVATVTTTCTPSCPTGAGVHVTWQSAEPSPTLLPGVYFVRAVAPDQVGNRSAAQIRIIKAP